MIFHVAYQYAIFLLLQVNGIARDFILTGLKLHDGVTYYVTLISCNGAQICSTATTTGMMVDTTPLPEVRAGEFVRYIYRHGIHCYIKLV